MQKLTRAAELCGMTLLTVGGAVMLAAPAQEARAAVSRRLGRRPA